jgi:hypothetical protein
MPRWPNKARPRARNADAHDRTESRSARSSGSTPTEPFPVAALIEAAASSPLAGDRQAMYTRHPCPASAEAVARPIPVLPPVTTTVRPPASTTHLQKIVDSYPGKYPG